jgi:hypothetical protein
MNGRLWKIVAAAIGLALNTVSNAQPTYNYGHITNVTFAGDTVMIMMDVGVPDNCIGTPYGWMIIPANYKSMSAFVLGLWMRGDLRQVGVTVYTTGRDSYGNCQINQIDPVE